MRHYDKAVLWSRIVSDPLLGFLGCCIWKSLGEDKEEKKHVNSPKLTVHLAKTVEAVVIAEDTWNFTVIGANVKNKSL